MISQVKDNDLRQEAYKAGIEFFINKPINIIEVKSVVKRVTDTIEMQKIKYNPKSPRKYAIISKAYND